MDGDQKIFGMTRMQVGIIAGMGGVLLILVCVGGWLAVRNLIGGGSPAVAQVPPTVQPTVTSVLAVSPTPDVTPTLTPIPYEQLIPAGWNQYKTPLVEIWMPTNFKLADKKTADRIASNSSSQSALILAEVSSKSSLYTMFVAVYYTLFNGDSLDAFIDDNLTFAYQSRLTDRRTVTVNSSEARRFVYESRLNNVDYNELMYIFLDGDTVWVVHYAAEITEFFEYLPVFEQSIKTFRTVKY